MTSRSGRPERSRASRSPPTPSPASSTRRRCWRLLLGPTDALRALALFHYAIAALATYALVRLLGGGRVGAAYGALAYALSTHLIARASMLGLLGGVAWLPVCLLAAEAAVHARPQRRALAVTGVAAAFACSILAGSQQITAVAAIACVMWLWMRRGREGPRPRRSASPPEWACRRSPCCRASSCCTSHLVERGTPIPTASARWCPATCGR